MTTAENFRSTVARAACDVDVAGVPWPAYKLIALLIAAVVVVVVGVATLSASAAVLSGAGVGAIAWVGLGMVCSSRR